ncbi:unnamed protein product [Lepeophtheirus salmonis]|uniref:(salmon louse) hypothetical protein n=1 Tax=Lepeophtheirus salmonis TaxID=72036 RepID=A0A7R8CSQ2_LEPSM|nr:unnamed protein product [Lepeophtheirus salmonis]CAF2919199.1 unnamed protein product [Lepeophtheirus salmonis]
MAGRNISQEELLEEYSTVDNNDSGDDCLCDSDKEAEHIKRNAISSDKKQVLKKWYYSLLCKQLVVTVTQWEEVDRPNVRKVAAANLCTDERGSSDIPKASRLH